VVRRDPKRGRVNGSESHSLGGVPRDAARTGRQAEGGLGTEAAALVAVGHGVQAVQLADELVDIFFVCLRKQVKINYANFTVVNAKLKV
jgi:hypothetical protein